jgi:hypothetical protein
LKLLFLQLGACVELKARFGKKGASMKAIAIVATIFLAAVMIFAQNQKLPGETSTGQTSTDGPTVSVIGYVRDSGCVHRFHEVVKPLPNGCLEACVRGGSPLVVLTKNEQVYHPISTEMPDVDVRGKLLPFVGKLVKVTGHVYSRGSNAISLEQIEEVKE